MSGGLREQMPVTAWLVDQLRVRWGAEVTDALVRRAMRGMAGGGQGFFYSAEFGPDGVLREFGCSGSGGTFAAEDGRLVWFGEETKGAGPCSKHR